MEVGKEYLDLLKEESSANSSGAENPVLENPQNTANDNPDDNPSSENNSGGGDNPTSNDNPNPLEDKSTSNNDDLPLNEEYDEKKVLAFFEKNNRKVKSIEDLLKEPEVKTVNPYEGISDKAKAFLTYHQETGRDYEDYLELQKDISAIPDIELAREKVRLENGRNWTNEEIDSFLEKQLKVDLSDLDALDAADKIALAGFSKSLRESKLSDQEKYKQPLENRQNNQQQPIGEDEVELENGQRMKREDYDKLVVNRQNYLNGVKDSTDKITESSFSIKIDDKGSDKTLTYSYEFSKEDKQMMLSSAEDLQKTLSSMFETENGFNHSELVESMFWMNKSNREKAISALVHKALAERTESMMKEEGNVRLGANDDLPEGKKGEKREVPIKNTDGFGVKYNFNN